MFWAELSGLIFSERYMVQPELIWSFLTVGLVVRASWARSDLFKTCPLLRISHALFHYASPTNNGRRENQRYREKGIGHGYFAFYSNTSTPISNLYRSHWAKNLSYHEQLSNYTLKIFVKFSKPASSILVTKSFFPTPSLLTQSYPH